MEWDTGDTASSLLPDGVVGNLLCGGNGMEAPVNPRIYAAARVIVLRGVMELVEEIQRVDARLLQLGNSEEDEIEEIVLTALREHLEEELRNLLGFIEQQGKSVASEGEAETAEKVSVAT